MIDTEGYRPNVGIILCNDDGNLFWARRVGEDSWQFPQGGIQKNESPEEALYRELEEEVGLTATDVEVMGCTNDWLRYEIPRRYIRRYPRRRTCIGQKQMWYLLRLVSSEQNVCLDASEKPEFDSWRWIDYWTPAEQVVFFKQQVYRSALQELAPLVQTAG